MGGTIPLGYDVKDRKLVINQEEADRVRLIFRQYLALGCVAKLRADLDQRGVRSKQRVLTTGQVFGGCSLGQPIVSFMTPARRVFDHGPVDR